MKASEAAPLLGVEKQHVRLLIRQGKLKATRRVLKYPTGKKAYYWDISKAEIRRFNLIPQVTGRPRGKKQPEAVLKLKQPARRSTLSQYLGKGSNNEEI